MNKFIIKILGVLLPLLILFSCSRRIRQDSMFAGRSHKTKKKGVYDAGMNTNKPISVQIAKEADKLTKNDTNPKKAAKKVVKANKKKQAVAQKARNKNNRKRHIKVKTTKGKPTGDT